MLQRSRRRVLATILALSWVLGIETLPALHLAAHDDDHTHDASGTIVRVTFGGHRHADGTVHGAHAIELEVAAPKSRRIEQLAVRGPSDHAASGIAHHATALQSSPPPLLEPLAVTRAWVEISVGIDERLDALVLARANARGPPVA